MMKRFSLMIVVLLIFITSPVFALQVPKTHLVSVEWLAKNMDNPHLVIVDVRGHKAYMGGHIPHAVSIPMFFKFVDGYIGNVKFMLDTPYQITKIFRDAGISNNSVVIFYGDNSNSGDYADATRAFWSAWVYGLRKIAILHGGINAWIAQHKSLSKYETHPTIGHFKITTVRLNAIAEWPYIYYALITKKIQLIDARPMSFYSGSDPSPVFNGYSLIAKGKAGHIPGAIDIFAGDFSKKVDGYYELKSPNGIREVFEIHHVDLNRPIVSYCFIAHWGSAPWFVGKFLANAKHIKVYDGSMVEYSRMPLPLVQGSNLY